MITGPAGHLDEGTLAAYVLGGLGRAEAAARDRHLLRCGACRDRLADLAEVRRMLDLVPALAVLEDPSLTDRAAAPAPRVPAGAARPGRARARAPMRRWLSVAAVAAAAVIGAAVVPVLVSRGGAPEAGRPVTIMVTGFDVSTHVTATMWLRPGPTASVFKLRLAEVPADITLRVVANRLDGSMVFAGRWRVPSHGTGTVFELTGSVDVTAADLAGFQVQTASGDVLVSLKMPRVPGSARPAPPSSPGRH